MNGYIKKQALMDYCSNQVTRTIDLNDIARFPIAEIYTKADMVAMLDKLRAEIDNALSDGMIHKKTVLGIIDKYKAETENP